MKFNSKKERDHFILQNIPLVNGVVRQFSNHRDKEDFFSAGCLGLCAAVDHFDPEAGNRFSTFAIVAIRNEILKLYYERQMVIIPQELSRAKKNLSYIFRNWDILVKDPNIPPSLENISKHLNCKPDDIGRVINTTCPRAYSFTELKSQQDESLGLSSVITNIPSSDETPENLLLKKEEIEELKKQINELSEPARTFVWLNAVEGLSVTEIAGKKGVSRQYVYSVIRKAHRFTVPERTGIKPQNSHNGTNTTGGAVQRFNFACRKLKNNNRKDRVVFPKKATEQSKADS